MTGILSLIACLSLYATEETTSRIYFGNAAVAGKEYIYSPKQTSAANYCKKAAGIKKETSKPVVESAITEHESATVVLPDFPFAPSSSAFSRDGRESATISPQQRQDKPLPAVKTFLGNTYPDTSGSGTAFFLPEQRQKLSPAAIQYGMLTSLASTSPPATINPKD